MIARHRLAFLLGTLIVTGGLSRLAAGNLPVVPWVALLAMLAVVGALLALTTRAVNAPLPEEFVLRDGTFATPPDLRRLTETGLSTVAGVFGSGSEVSDLLRGRHLAWGGWWLVFWPLVVALLWWVTLSNSFGLRLRPDGLLDRRPSGSLFVPWEARPAVEAFSKSGLSLRYAYPELIKRTGLRRNAQLVSSSAEFVFVARAIGRYSAKPDLRPLIGTPGELALLNGHG